MPAHRTLRLRKETLAELTTDDLTRVVGGTYTTSFESCPTWICTVVVNLARELVRVVTVETSIDTCP